MCSCGMRLFLCCIAMLVLGVPCPVVMGETWALLWQWLCWCKGLMLLIDCLVAKLLSFLLAHFFSRTNFIYNRLIYFQVKSKLLKASKGFWGLFQKKVVVRVLMKDIDTLLLFRQNVSPGCRDGVKDKKWKVQEGLSIKSTPLRNRGHDRTILLVKDNVKPISSDEKLARIWGGGGVPAPSRGWV